MPTFVLYWPHKIILLVWRSLDEFCDACPLLKDSSNRRVLSLEKQEEYKVVVFDSYPEKLPASLLNLYGGYPILVYDVSTLGNEYLFQLDILKDKQIYALYLPFYLSYAKTTLATDLFINRKRGSNLEDELKKFNKINWNAMCCCCFGNLNGLGTIYHEWMDGSEHKMCQFCMLEDKTCNHITHEFDMM